MHLVSTRLKVSGIVHPESHANEYFLKYRQGGQMQANVSLQLNFPPKNFIAFWNNEE